MSFDKSLKETSEELRGLIVAEKEHQKDGLELIASKNFTSNALIDVWGLFLTNKYSEGCPEIDITVSGVGGCSERVTSAV